MRQFYLRLRVMAMTLMLMAALPLAAQTYWDGTASRDWTGTGSEDDPYIITTPQQLAGLAEAVNGGRDFRGEYIKLGADLYMCDPDAEQDARPQWTPIGGVNVEDQTGDGGGYRHDTLRFCGTFDGAGHTVYNVYHSTLPDLTDWDDPFGSGVLDVSGWYRGFFGWVEEATVKNLHLRDVNIIGAATVGGMVMVSKNSTITGCSVSGVVGSLNADVGGASGGLVADNQGGTIENCTSSANVKGIRGVGCLVGYNSGTIRDCHTTGDAHGVQYYVGGLVGSNLEGGLIEHCSSAGEVKRDYYQYAIEDCAGFVGQNVGTIRECTSSANVISSQDGAGFCGVNGGRIESCYATGDVTVSRFGCKAATFVGANGRSAQQALDPVPYEGIIINCFATGKCTNTDEGALHAFMSNFQSRNNRETLTVFCSTNMENYTTYGTNIGGALLRTTAGMQSKEFTDTLNMVAALTGTSLWEWREGNYPVPTGVKGEITTCFSGGGSGTEDDPFRIRTKEDLERVSALTGLGWRFDNQYILLENDIALNAPFEEWGTTAPTQWQPIGRFTPDGLNTTANNGFEHEFRGTFDGGFHSVRNMYLNDVTGVTPQGFFGIINGATVKNLSVEGAWIKAQGSTGILVGKSTRYCMPTNILQCHTSGTAEGSWAAGGIIGDISLDGNTNIINCSSAAALVPGEGGAHMVVGNQNYVGGTTYSNDTVANYFFTGRMEGEDPGSFFGKEISINCYYDMEKWVRPDKWTGIETYGRTTEYLQSKEFANVFNYYVAQYNERHADSPLHYWQVNTDDYPSLTETEPPHTVTYVTGGEYYTPQPVLDDSRIVPPPVPEQEGQVFYGWYSDENRTKPYIFDTMQITSSFPLYAKWQAELVPDFTPFTNPFATTYVISTPEQLLGFSRAVQGVEGVIDRMDFVGITVKLGADIMLNDTSGWQHWGDYTYGRQWEPISTDEVYCTFGGTFDGDGHTISGMYISDDSHSDATNVGIGLFARLRPDAVVKNLNIKASRIIFTSRYGQVGLLVGFNRGTVDSCHVEGEIEVVRCTAGMIAGVCRRDYDGIVGSDIIREGIGSIRNSSSLGRVESTDATGETYLGGLIGQMAISDSIVNCSTDVAIRNIGENAGAGGITGTVGEGVISSCAAELRELDGSLNIGGITGNLYKGTVEKCHLKGNIACQAGNVGGIVGYLRQDSKITECSFDGTIEATGDYVGGIYGNNYRADTVSGCSVSGQISGGNYTGGISGTGGCRYSTSSATVKGMENVGGITGAGGAYHCTATGDVSGTDCVGGISGGGSGSINDCTASGNVSGRDKVGGLAGECGWVNNSSASGEVTGANRVGGLVGSLWEDYERTISQSHATGKVTATGNQVGGLIGYGRSKSYDYGVTITESYATGDVTGAGQTGGFAGFLYGEITESYATGNVKGENSVGGFVGRYEENSIYDCFATGEVTGTDTVGGFVGYTMAYGGGGPKRSYSTGKVQGEGASTGGFAGAKSVNSRINNCYYDSETSGMSDSELGTPLSTIGMKAKKSYEEWDFETTWGRKDTINDGYPYLRWMYDEFIADDEDPKIPASGITISKEDTTLEAGMTLQLTATITPDNAEETVQWSTSAAAVASVDVNGLVTTIAPGEAVITATTSESGLTAECRVTVTEPIIRVTKVTIDETSVPSRIKVGESVQLAATVEPENAVDKTVTWSIGDNEYVSLTPDGVLTGIKETGRSQSVIITATAGGISDVYSPRIRVEAAAGAVTGVRLDYEGITISAGGTWQLNATVEPEDAENKSVTWESSDETVATVDGSGLVTGKSAGSATVTVRTVDGGYTAQCSVTVEGEETVLPTGVTLSHMSLSMKEGEEAQLIASVQPADATDKSITWESNAPETVSVDSEGRLTAHKAGTAVITAKTVNGFSAFCMVTVEEGDEPEIPVTGIVLSHRFLDLTEGETAQLTVTIEPADATDRSISWESSDEDIATVGADGTVRAIAAGTSVITVTTTDGGFTAECLVNVKAAAPQECTDIAYSETFASSLGEFSVVNEKGTNDWYWNSKFGCAYMNGYSSGENSDWLISPAFDLTGMESAEFSFTDAFGYGNEANWRTHCEVLVGAGYNGDVNAVTWYAISSGLTFGSGEWWEWLTHRLAVPSALLGQRDVAVAFRYRISGAEDAPAWEIKNFSLTAKCADGGVTIPVSSIMLPSSVPPLAIGESCTLTPTIFPENATDKRVMWTSGDVTVAVVDANGTVTGISEGETVITATTVDGGYTAECRITVVGGTDVEMTAADAVTVYPNPVRDVLNVETGGAAVVRMEMTDAAGHAVMSIEGDEHTVDVSALPEGLYLLRIETERGVTVRKIVKRM